MKKTSIFYFLAISAGMLLTNCSKTPVYPEVPAIEFKSHESVSPKDSLILTIKFKDGDGDLGLNGTETSYPYNEYDFVLDNGNYIHYGSSPSLPPFSCKNYLISDVDGDTVIDTVLINYNFNHFNYLLDVYVKQPDDTFIKFDFTNICPDYNGRFQRLNTSDKAEPIEGELSYNLKFLGDFFINQTVKFKIKIQDRALNKSNEIETPEILIN